MPALLALADAVERWHGLQRPRDIRLEVRAGVELERRWIPLRSVGIYVPRGLISTLVMCAVPARAAGRRANRVVTPPEGSGRVAAAARLLGLGEVWAVGGPPAIAALAYGTASIPRVDKVCGPGGAYVNEAKLLVARDVAIDLPAGPSEVVVLAGADAEPRVVALEVAAQAEHGPDSVCTVVDGTGISRPRSHRSKAGAGARRAPGRRRGGSADPQRRRGLRRVELRRRRGDYATGGNHVLPTGGWARSVGGLGLETFLKPITMQRLTPAGLAGLRPTVEALAAVEGMYAHAEAVRR